MPRSTIVILVVSAGALVLVVFLGTQGLDRASLWAGVLGLFLAIFAFSGQVWSTWLAPDATGRRHAPDATRATDAEAGGTGSSGAVEADLSDERPDPGWHRPIRIRALSVAAAVVCVVVAVVLVVVVFTEEDDGGGHPDWVQVRTGERLVLADGQTFDLDTGSVGGEDAPEGDLLLSQRADRLGAREPGELAVVLPGLRHDVRRCLDATNWDGTIDGFHDLRRGTELCVRTVVGACAMITIEEPPDVVTRVFTFRYTLWERR
ncbi:hypothetical protein ABZS77_02830 [Micromonospora sp. NPDC005298]|uniref:hypothetical protein n=1 Tax=Micromonospora sp. NPDC005298 TaxID=3156873 RepID=UPI0033B5C4B9